MSGAGIVVLLLLAVLGMIALAVLAVVAERRKTEALQALAVRRGWTYGADAEGRPKRYRGFNPFNQGHSRRATHVMTGREGSVTFEVFQYRYVVSSGKHSQTYNYIVAAAGMPIHGPGLTIQAEHFGHKLFDALGGEDIDFESAEFSRRFWVRCSDRRFAYDVLNAAMIEHLLVGGQHWSWQWRGGTLMLHRIGAIDAARAEAVVQGIVEFHARLPRHLLASATPPAEAARRTRPARGTR